MRTNSAACGGLESTRQLSPVTAERKWRTTGKADVPRVTPAAVLHAEAEGIFPTDCRQSDGGSQPANSLTSRVTCCKTAETLQSGRCAILPFDHDSSGVEKKIFCCDSATSGKNTIEYFHQWGCYSSGSYCKRTKCKSDCSRLVWLTLAARRVDKWPQAGGLLINCSSLHSSAPSMSTHAPRTDIHLAISNLKSGQRVFIRIRWGCEVLVHWRTEWELWWNFTTNPRRTILCI